MKSQNLRHGHSKNINEYFKKSKPDQKKEETSELNDRKVEIKTSVDSVIVYISQYLLMWEVFLGKCSPFCGKGDGA